MRIIKPFLNVYKKKDKHSELVTQLLYGETFKKIKKSGSWLKIKNDSDKYVGFIKNINFSKNQKNTHKICSIKAPLYKKPNTKYKIKTALSFGSRIKIIDSKGGYDKSNFLTWNSSVSYNTLKDSLKLSEMTSNVRVKSFSGSELFRVRMYHNFYKLGGNEGDDVREPIDQMLNIWEGEFPRLTRMNISTDMKFKLAGSAFGTHGQLADPDTTEDIEDEFYTMEKKSKSKENRNNIWESKLQFKYSADWKHTDDEWDYKFSMKSVNSINLSKNWTLSYIADFNLKEKEMTYHSFRFYRPLHCWEFSFNYWPRGNSSGFSLQINVKNPDLKDIKLTSKDGKRGFGGF